MYLYNLKNCTSKLARIRLDLSEYNYDIQYIKGFTNVGAGALSRIKIETIRDEYAENQQVLAAHVMGVVTRSKAKLVETNIVPEVEVNNFKEKRVIELSKNTSTLEIPCMKFTLERWSLGGAKRLQLRGLILTQVVPTTRPASEASAQDATQNDRKNAANASFRCSCGTRPSGISHSRDANDPLCESGMRAQKVNANKQKKKI